LTIVEDAAQHADLLQKLLNVPDEGTVKLDKGIGMDIDTQMIIISNPDLEAQLNKHADREGFDPLKALKRRLDKHEFTYLTNLSLEAELVRRELTNETEIWEAESYDELETKIREPLVVSVRSSDGVVRERELAPHAIEAAALYAVGTRLDTETLPPGIDLVDKALIYDRGYLQDGDERRYKEEFEFGDVSEGTGGIPVTYTRDVIADLLHEETERHHPELNVEDVIMPRDILNAMAEGLYDAPVFSANERVEYENRLVPIKNHVFAQQESDVIDAVMRDKQVDESTVEEYIEHVYAWVQDETIENDRGESIDPDPLKMKVFEIEHLGRFDEGDYDGTDPTDGVEAFRSEKILTALNRHAWRNRDEDFHVSDIDPREVPVIETVLGSHDWDDVGRTYGDLDPTQWADPPSGTETEAVKEHTLRNMQELFGYSAAAAELTSRHVMGQVSYRWE
jgi:predicted Ser/Thr protein kinase